MSVTQISYAHGNPNSPYFGRVELLRADDRFEASYEHDARLAWRGALAGGTFARAVAAMTDASFPTAAPLGQLVPGSSLLELGWEIDGTWQRIRLGEDDRSYQAVDIIASSILSVLDSKLARMPPGVSSPIVELRRDA